MCRMIQVIVLNRALKRLYNSDNEQYAETIEDANIENRKTKSVKRNT